jgi:hypothetical protein
MASQPSALGGNPVSSTWQDPARDGAFDHLLEVHAEAEVTWGPDPADVTAVAAGIRNALPPGWAEEYVREVARRALLTMHEREAAQ